MYVVHTELINVQCMFVFYYRSCKRLILVCGILLYNEEGGISDKAFF